jgi:hypothetical protein
MEQPETLNAGSLDALVRLVVTGVTEKHGQAWDLICQADGIGTITVDPFVSCAWPAGTDAERRLMVGKEYVMANFRQSKDGCYLPETFYEPNDPSSATRLSEGQKRNKSAPAGFAGAHG